MSKPRAIETAGDSFIHSTKIYWALSLFSSTFGQSSLDQGGSVVKNPPANARHLRNGGSVPGLGRTPGEGNSNPLHYSCLENPMDRGAWWVTVHRVTKSQAQLSDWARMHACPWSSRRRITPATVWDCGWGHSLPKLCAYGGGRWGYKDWKIGSKKHVIVSVYGM